MKTLGMDKVTRAALVMIALGIWSLFLLQARTVIQPREVPAVAQGTGKIAQRYQLVSQGVAKMYLTDTQTGRTWGALGSTSLSSDEFKEVTPEALQPARP